MPAFNTPHGVFDTSFFAIAESLPKRLLKDSESKPAVYSEFDAQEGTPYVRDISLGLMSKSDIVALDFVLAGIAAHNKTTPPFELNAYMDNEHTATPQCFIRYMGRKENFDQAQSLQVTNATSAFKQHLLDEAQYEEAAFDLSDVILPGVLRKFDKRHAFEANVLEHLITAYASERAYQVLPPQEDHIHLHIEEEAFQAMLKNELGKAKQPRR